jgi:iron complex outermembrane receptor protein
LLLAVPASTGHTNYGSLELLGAATLGKTHHSLLFGAEVFDVRSYQEVVYNFTPFTTDLYAPNLRPVPGDLLLNPDWAVAIWTAERWYSAYVQDQVALGDRLSLLLGARYDYAREWLDVAAGLPLTDLGADRRSDHAFKRRIGLVYRPTAALSLYTHYLENFGISTGIYGGEGTEAAGNLVPPEAAREWEVGVKSELLQGRVIGSLAWFNLTQSNIALPTMNVIENARGFVTVTGVTRSRGVEADVQGEIAPGVKLIASYAFLDSRIVDDANTFLDATGNPVAIPGNTGKRFFGIPRHGGSLWVSYRPAGALRRLKLGVGVIARTWREGDNANDYRLPGFSRWSLLAAYDLPVADGRLSLQLNVDNLFNTRYFESLNGTHNVMPGAPRRWLLSARMELK